MASASCAATPVRDATHIDRAAWTVSFNEEERAGIAVTCDALLVPHSLETLVHVHPSQLLELMRRRESTCTDLDALCNSILALLAVLLFGRAECLANYVDMLYNESAESVSGLLGYDRHIEHVFVTLCTMQIGFVYRSRSHMPPRVGAFKPDRYRSLPLIEASTGCPVVDPRVFILLRILFEHSPVDSPELAWCTEHVEIHSPGPLQTETCTYEIGTRAVAVLSAVVSRQRMIRRAIHAVLGANSTVSVPTRQRAYWHIREASMAVLAKPGISLSRDLAAYLGEWIAACERAVLLNPNDVASHVELFHRMIKLQ